MALPFWEAKNVGHDHNKFNRNNILLPWDVKDFPAMAIFTNHSEMYSTGLLLPNKNKNKLAGIFKDSILYHRIPAMSINTSPSKEHLYPPPWMTEY